MRGGGRSPAEGARLCFVRLYVTDRYVSKLCIELDAGQCFQRAGSGNGSTRTDGQAHTS